MKNKFNLLQMSYCITPNEDFSMKELHDKMTAAGSQYKMSFVRKKVEEMHERGAIDKKKSCPVKYACTQEQIYKIGLIYAEPVKRGYCAIKKSDCKIQNPWLGVSMKGRPGTTERLGSATD
jgi:hypothetical protein